MSGLRQITLVLPKELRDGYKQTAAKARRAALEGALRWWYKVALPRHFTPRGASDYGYHSRTSKHNKLKQETYGHQNPLQFTGALRAKMLEAMPSPVVAGKKASIIFRNLPAYTFMDQKVSDAEIFEALDATGGSIKAAAAQVGVAYRTIERRINKKIGDGRRQSRYMLAKIEMDALRGTWGLDAMTEWQRWHLLCIEAKNQHGGDIRAAATSLGMSISTFGKYLRNVNKKPSPQGRTQNKVRELETISDAEMNSFASIAYRLYTQELKAATA